MLDILRSLFKLRRIKQNTLVDISMDEPFVLRLLSVSAKHKHVHTANIIYPNKPNIVSPYHIDALASFSSSTKAKCLSFFLYPKLPSQIAERIFKSLNERTNLEYSLQDLGINLDGINDNNKLHHFTTYLTTTTALRILRLKADIDNSANDLHAILVALQLNKSLHSIYIDSFLSSSCLNDSHITQLLETVRNKELRTLSLSGHQLSSEATDQLCRELSRQKNLQSLNLASINCTDAQLARIRTLIEEENSSIQSLTIGQKSIREQANQITKNGINYFLEGIKQNNTLKHLAIGYFDHDWLTTKLAAIIQENKSLESLTLKHSMLHPLSQHGITCLLEALKTNTTLLRFVEEQDNKTTIKFKESHANVLLNRKINRRTVNQINNLLERNKLIKAIQADLHSLPDQLKQFKNAILDDTFFVTLIKLLPEPFLLKYDELLTNLISTPQSAWNPFKRNKKDLNRINRIISLLSQQAQKDDHNSKMALGFIYKNGLFNQSIDPDTARNIFTNIMVTSTNPNMVNEARFEIGHLDLIYSTNKNTLVNAASYFDAVVSSNSNVKIAARLRTHCINHLNGNKSLVLPDEKIIEADLEKFRRSGNMISYFQSVNQMTESCTKALASKPQIKANNSNSI